MWGIKIIIPKNSMFDKTKNPPSPAPSKYAPVLPINIFDGYILKYINAASAPIKGSIK